MADELSQEDQNYLDNFESQLSSEYPDECIPLFKKLSLCRISHSEWVNKNLKGYYKETYMQHPLQNIIGCEEEYAQFNSCYGNFMKSYEELKRFASIIEGKAPYRTSRTEQLAHLKKHALKIAPEIVYTGEFKMV